MFIIILTVTDCQYLKHIFIIFQGIAENLGEAIHDSKRTILLISPAFIEGQWPEFEVQCALMEWLGKSSRVIPIIYRPIDDVKHKISRSLSHLLKSITYLEWPQEGESKKEAEFWRRLLLALPEKKNEDKTDNEKSDKKLTDKSLYLDLKVDLNSEKDGFEENKIDEKQEGMVNFAMQLEETLTGDSITGSSANLTDEYIV